MTSAAGLEGEVAEQVATIRRFNRFYTARLGLLRRRHLNGEFTLTEARLMYEIDANPQTTARSLCRRLELDAGYISRLLAGLARKKQLRQVRSNDDGREKQLILTRKGKQSVARLNDMSAMQLHEMLSNVSPTDREELVAALRSVQRILRKSQKTAVRIERLTVLSDHAHAILQEYYEAVHVVWRDKPGDLKEILKEPASGMWLAWMGEEVAGCVVLRKLPSIPLASECKRLYVRPAARGHHIADRLMDALEEFARGEGVQCICLDTYDDLKPAIALYERRGYQRCERYNENPQATLFMSKKIA
jgi:DNA-binding MarR family transcriptional regulator/N-acetylglutamate synthase-like GNAT family acetyltransferase